MGAEVRRGEVTVVRPHARALRARSFGIAWAIWGLAVGSSPGLAGPRFLAAPVDSATRVDHDALPIQQPAKSEENFYHNATRMVVMEPLAHGFDIPDKILWLAHRLGIET